MVILASWFLMLIAGVLLVTSRKCVAAGRILLTICLLEVLFISGYVAVFILYLFSAGDRRYTVLALLLLGILGLALLRAIWKVLPGKKIGLCLCGAAGISVALIGLLAASDMYEAQIPTVGESTVLAQYLPYEAGSRLAEPEKSVSLHMEQELPVLDGATALYPVYAAFAKAVYPEKILREDPMSGVLRCTSTTGAFRALADREADIIFTAGPSGGQMEYAKKTGVNMKLTPIGREAFVFFVNSKNPLESVTVEQIQGIYSGVITDWSELGAGRGRIRAFQRREGSGSQTALQSLMGNIPMAQAPTEDVADLMSGIITDVAAYKNYKEAIGFSFRFFSTEMVGENRIKLLRVEGIEPSAERIADGSYPLASEFYAITREGEETPEVERLLDWILSEEGQSLIEKTGYVPLYP